ncbi:MAG: P-loop NTPase [Propionibacteriaceae bacterium]|jgi:secretion/DNA translocation related CpaE-like protein|nr:P-loop NTPase [Propionibacteriaceae bacterium]
MQRKPSLVALVTADQHLIHVAQASAAAVGSSLSVVADGAEIQEVWRTAAAVLVGADRVDQLSRWSLPRRDQLYLLGDKDQEETLCHWSMPFGAAVIVVPDGARWLSRVLSGHLVGADTGVAVTVSGGSGGVGASTLAVSLALLAVQRAMKVALVDGDPGGGGLDLLLGGENTAGWRWDRLRDSTGQIADITPVLPQIEGITVVSMQRPVTERVPDDAYEAVVDCLVRSHDLVLIDRPRGSRRVITAVRRGLVVSSQSVRSIAATRTGSVTGSNVDWGLVVRRGGSVQVHEAAQAIGLPLVGAIPTVRELPDLADRGVPPFVTGRWRKACAPILRWCLGDPAGPRRSR